MLKGKTVIKIFKSFPFLKNKTYWGNHFCSRGCCVSTIGLDETKIRKICKISGTERKKKNKKKTNRKNLASFRGLLKPTAMRVHSLLCKTNSVVWLCPSSVKSFWETHFLDNFNCLFPYLISIHGKWERCVLICHLVLKKKVYLI